MEHKISGNEKCITSSFYDFFNLFWHVTLITAVSEVIHPNCLFNLINKHLIKWFIHTERFWKISVDIFSVFVCVFQPLPEQFSG